MLRRAHAVLLLLLGIAIAVNGCGRSSSRDDAGGLGGGSAGTAGGGTAGTGGAPACSNVDGPSSGETCNAIAAGGPCVTGTFSTAAPPTPAGGAFASGTYNLVSETFYGSAADGMNFLPGVPFRQKSVLSDVTATSFTLDQVWTTGTVVARLHETVAVSGMTATFTQTCPATDAGSNWSYEFTATSSSITLFYSVTNGVIEVTVYNKAS
jgi:hypothetical protein